MMTPDSEKQHPAGSTASTQSHSNEESGAREKTREAMARARSELRSLSEQARQQAIETKDEAKAQGREFISERKNRLAEEFHQVGDAVRRAGEELRREGHSSFLARYTDKVADGADRAAGYLWGHEVEDLAADVQDFTRRHPEVVFGGLFVAGLAAARVLKASMPESRRPARRVSEGSNYPYSQGYAVSSGEAATTYQPPEVYPASTPGRM